MSASVRHVGASVLEELPGDLPRTVLAVSDLHLGEGLDRETRRHCRRENFFGDAVFKALLAKNDPEATWLVLNGDTFDFVRITAKPGSERDWKLWAQMLKDIGAPRSVDELRGMCRGEHPYGLGTQDYESVWKLLAVRRGHPVFFRALQQWVLRGGTILFLKGNHDLELFWPAVRLAIRVLIRAHAAPAARRVHFRQRGFHLRNLYFEHGHRFERTTAVHGEARLGDRRRLRLPFGSLVNRYVINKLEGIELFFANIKPLKRLLKSLLRRHPLKSLRIGLPALRFLPRAVRAYGTRVWEAAVCVGFPVVWLAALAAVVVKVCREASIYGYVSRGGVALIALILLIPVLVPVVWMTLRKRRYPAGEDESAAGVWKTLTNKHEQREFERQYGVVGHTHVADVQVLRPLDGQPPPPGAEIWYVNTGTWAPRFEEKRPDLMGRVVHSVVRFQLVGKEYRHECFEWTPPGAVYTPAVLFEPTCGT